MTDRNAGRLTFTDVDMKLLMGQLKDRRSIGPRVVEALLARLEAAEAALVGPAACGCVFQPCAACRDFYAAWGAVSGR